MGLRFASADSWDGMRALELARQARYLAETCDKGQHSPGPASAEPEPGRGSAGAPSGKTPVKGRDVLVTRPGSPNSWTQPPFFVDWLSISQDFAQELPCVDAGAVFACDESGELVWKTCRAVKHEGSFETAVNVRCDGHRVSFTGNVSRFGRSDNVWGFDFWQCLARINAVLAVYGLPPFSAGLRMGQISRGGVRYVWTGARVSRIDLTANFEAGSPENAHAVMQYLGEQHANRKAGRVLGQGETVDFGAGSRRQYWKAYIKHLELVRHACADERLIEYCRIRGIVRFEGTVRSNALTDIGAAYLGDYESGWAMGELVKLFEAQSEILSRAQHTTDDLSGLPKAVRATARDYLAGMDMRATMGRASFYSHRRQLLPFGIDIAVRNVRPFTPRRQVIQLVPAVAPSWYELAA